MKNIRSILLPALLISLTPSLSAAQSDHDKACKTHALSIAKKYCTNAYEIIATEDAKSICNWMDGETSKIELSQFATAVHESLHGYDSEIGRAAGYNWETKMWTEGFYIDKGIKLTIPRFEVFRTSTLHPNYYPKEVQQLSRYGTYIHYPEGKTSWLNENKSAEELKEWGLSSASESSASSNMHGIFGLLEEFNAYYHGSRSQYELLKSGAPITSSFGGSGSSETTNEISSYYEFNIFMAYYLKYAKEKEPEVYKRMFDSQKLRMIYTLIELNWRNLLTDIYSNPKIAKRFPCYEGEDLLYTTELQTIMNAFLLDKNELGKYTTYASSLKYNPEIIKTNRGSCQEDTPFSEQSFDTDPDNSTMISSREKGYYYVVAKSYSDIRQGVLDHMTLYKADYPVSGLYFDTDMKLYMFLAKYQSKEKANSIANKYREKFPDIKVVGP